MIQYLWYKFLVKWYSFWIRIRYWCVGSFSVEHLRGLGKMLDIDAEVLDKLLKQEEGSNERDI